MPDESRTTSAPFETVNADGKASMLIICDHASNRVPEEMARLGLEESIFERHIAYDIGAAAVARGLAEILDAPALLAGFSRLVIDPNRQPGDPTSIPAVSDGVPVPGNTGLTEAEQNARTERFFHPYHHELTQLLAHIWRSGGVPPVLFSVHSFTPRLLGEAERPWNIGVLWNRDPRLAVPLIERLRARGDLTVGDNEPYSGRETAYTIDRHAGAAGLANCAVEIRQNEIADRAGQKRWIEILAPVLRETLNQSNVHKVEVF